MENSSFDDIVVLRVKDICCTAYQKKLKKNLSKINGVYAIAINPEKSLVSVRGRVDVNLVLDTVTKTGKQAEIIVNPTYNTNESRHHPNAHERERKYHYQHGNPSPEKNRGYKMDESQKHHICEDYIPPPIDERFRRDFFNRSHDMRPNFPESVPRGFFPYRTYNQPTYNQPPSYGFGSLGQQSFGRPPLPSMYGYWSRPMQGYGNFAHYGYGNGRGWSYM